MQHEDFPYLNKTMRIKIFVICNLPPSVTISIYIFNTKQKKQRFRCDFIQKLLTPCKCQLTATLTTNFVFLRLWKSRYRHTLWINYNTLDWSKHIENVSGKATSSLGFLSRNNVLYCNLAHVFACTLSVSASYNRCIKMFSYAPLYI